jgi:hypothetical protein
VRRVLLFCTFQQTEKRSATHENPRNLDPKPGRMPLPDRPRGKRSITLSQHYQCSMPTAIDPPESRSQGLPLLQAFPCPSIITAPGQSSQTLCPIQA